MLARRKLNRVTTGEIIVMILLAIFSISCLYPFVYFIACSLNTATDTMKGGLMLWPRDFTLDNYRAAFNNKDIFQAFKISVIITVVGSLSTVVLDALAAYALTVKKLPFRNGITMFIYASTIFSGGVVPTFILYRNLGLLNNIMIYFLPGFYSFFTIVMMRTFMEQLPISLSEAAEIDGANEIRVFFSVILPLSMPLIATQLLFIAVRLWNEWHIGAFYVSDSKLIPAATFLQKLLKEADMTSNIEALKAQGIYVDDQMVVQTVTPDSLRMTFVVIIVTPILLVYPFLQKYFVKGVMVGAVKS